MDSPLSIEEIQKGLIGYTTNAPLSPEDKTAFLKRANSIFTDLQTRTAPYDYGGATGYSGDACVEPPYDNMSVSEAEEVFCKKPSKNKRIKGSTINGEFSLIITVSVADLVSYAKILEKETAKAAVFIPKCNTEDTAVIAIKDLKDAAKIRGRLFSIEKVGMFWPGEADENDFFMIAEYGIFSEDRKIPVGSRVRLTKNKREESERTGDIVAFSPDKGTVESIMYDCMYIVYIDDGFAVSLKRKDIELFP